MAKLIDDTVVVNGRLIQVWNEKRPKFSNADKLYYAVWVEDSKGGNEKCLLFTKEEIAKAEQRASKNPEDLTKKNLLIDLVD